MFGSAILTFVLAVAAASASPSPLSASNVEEYQLDNGLRVVLYRDERYPVVEARVVYGVGTADDPPEKVGLAHGSEHVSARGGFPGGTDVRSRMYGRGVWTSARTAWTTTTYWATAPANRLDVVLANESNRMRGAARFTRALLEKERRIVGQEMAQRLFGGIRERELAGLLDLLATNGDRRLVSTPETLARITAEDVEELVRENYVPANATLVLAGDLPDDVVARVEDYFGDLPPGEPSDAAHDSASPLPKAMHARARGLVPGAIALWTIPGAHSDDDAAARVIGSLLDLPILDDASRVLRIETTVFHVVGEAALFVRVDGTPDSQPEELLAELDAILATMVRSAIPAPRIRSASRRAAVAMHAELGTLAGRADRLASHVAAGRPASWLAEDERRLAAVDASTIATFAKSWLVGRPRLVLLVEGDASP